MNLQGIKPYESIPHLPGSRRSADEKALPAHQVALLTTEARAGDRVIVTEKLDGSNVAVLRSGEALIPLVRSGRRAEKSRHVQHHLFAGWVHRRYALFRSLLNDGERVCGEWLAQAHATCYDLTGRSPFAAFDLMEEDRRSIWSALTERAGAAGLAVVPTLHVGGPISIQTALRLLGSGHYGAVDPPEGVVYRLERGGQVAFLGKYVRPELEPGRYFPENRGGAVLWNWHPDDHTL